MFAGFLGGDDSNENDINLLPFELKAVYQNPFRILGLDDNAGVGEVRDAYRRLCISHVKHFSGLPSPKMSLIQITLAYHLCRKTVSGSPKKISQLIESSPYFDGIEPEDILPVLKPIRSGLFPCPPEYRGFRQLQVVFKSTKQVFVTNDGKAGKKSSAGGGAAAPMSAPTGSMAGTMGIFDSYIKTVFTFDVHYCMRLQNIERDYESLFSLYSIFAKEMIVVPHFPEMSISSLIGGTGDGHSLGDTIAEFFNRLHVILANKGMFSAGLLLFLDIPFEKIQTEEEGRIVQILDTPIKPPKTMSHIISEEWLEKWRRFVMGRGARRYKPPGPITNDTLAEKLAIEREQKSTRKEIKLSIHYRSVNYNVWRFYEIVHGGGPCIARENDNIYGPMRVSYLQAVILIQKFIRRFLAHRRLDKLYTLEFSRTLQAQSTIAEVVASNCKEKAEKTLNDLKNERNNEILEDVSIFTASTWRSKKMYEPAASLVKKKKDQETFARAGGMQIAAGSMVVQDVQPIVRIGSSSIYSRKLNEEDGIPFSIRQLPGTEVAMIVRCKVESFREQSKILSVNSMPTSGLTYEEVKQRVMTSSWPIELFLEGPLDTTLLPSLDHFVDLDGTGAEVSSAKMKGTAGAAINLGGVSKRFGAAVSTRFGSITSKLGKASETTGSVGGKVSRPQNEKAVALDSQGQTLVNDDELEADDPVKVNAVKLWLNQGMKFIKHNMGNSSTHLTTVRLTETKLYYRGKHDPKKLESKHWRSIELFDLKFVLEGDSPDCPYFQAKKKKLNVKCCFEIVTQDRSLHLEILPYSMELEERKKDFFEKEIEKAKLRGAEEPSDEVLERRYEKPPEVPDDKQEKRREEYARLLITAFKSVVKEMRGNQIFLDENGTPVRRARAKTTLRKVSQTEEHAH